jgi:hypothetical protein
MVGKILLPIVLFGAEAVAGATPSFAQAGTKPAPIVVTTPQLKMTGIDVPIATYDAKALRMTGIDVAPAVYNAKALSMTGTAAYQAPPAKKGTPRK